MEQNRRKYSGVQDMNKKSYMLLNKIQEQSETLDMKELTVGEFVPRVADIKTMFSISVQN